MADPGTGKPKVALVTWDVGHPDDIMAGAIFSQIVISAHERFDFTVVSRSVHPVIRPLVDWRRAPAPESPFRLRWAMFFATAAARLRGVDVDLVHTWGPAPMVPNRIDIASVNLLQAGYHAAADGRPPGAGPGWRFGRDFKVALERWSYGRRAGLLDVDADSARTALEKLVPGTRVIVTPRIVDCERFRPDPGDGLGVRAEEGTPEDDLVALFVGRDWDLKGLEPAIAGLARARAQAPSLRLWVAGGSDGERLRAMAAAKGVADRVDFLGHRDDIERLYRGADLFLLPTIYEHFSRASHEAAATKVPVIATPVGGIAELLEAGAGVAVERDPGSIAAALGRLAGDPALRARLGERGREVSLGFTAERSTGRYLKLYDELIGTAAGEERAARNRSTSSR